MAKKKKSNNQQPEKKAAENYYKLNTEAVERLVNAKDAPEVSDEEIRKYKSGGSFRIPSWLKILFAKFWFNGAVCYFFIWGLGIYMRDNLDLLFITSLGMGLITDLLVNHFLRSLEPEDHAYDKWMMVTFRKWWSMVLNVAYSAVVLFSVYQIYIAINVLAFGSDTSKAESSLGVEPLLFGLLYLLCDMLYIGIKNLFVKIIRDAESKVAVSNPQPRNSAKNGKK